GGTEPLRPAGPDAGRSIAAVVGRIDGATVRSAIRHDAAAAMARGMARVVERHPAPVVTAGPPRGRSRPTRPTLGRVAATRASPDPSLPSRAARGLPRSEAASPVTLRKTALLSPAGVPS